MSRTNERQERSVREDEKGLAIVLDLDGVVTQEERVVSRERLEREVAHGVARRGPRLGVGVLRVRH